MAARRLDLGEESPGSMETRCRVTPGGGDPRESATENSPPSGMPDIVRCPGVRVKGCGKSAPRGRQRSRLGKPHREQDQVGTTARKNRPVSRPVVRVGRARRLATGVPDEWSSHSLFSTSCGQNPAYRPPDRWPFMQLRLIVERTNREQSCHLYQ